MKFSQFFTKTTKDIPSDETSKNAKLLIRGGFIHKTMAGVYAYLPLGLRVLNKIENIVRKYLNAIGGQEILMNSLHPRQWWEQTNRWESVDVLFKLKSQTENEYALAPTHEEQITPLVKNYINSWKDLPVFDLTKNIFPLAIYQIQTKFRDELRSKAGLMRGREFRMQDLYDFHQNKESQMAYFELITETYHKIFQTLGLKSYAVDASGGSFSDKFSREFQVICQAGEDVIIYCSETGFACNQEVFEEAKRQWLQNGKPWSDNLQKDKAAEVGNIFDLGQKWVKAFEITYTDQNNQKQYPYMGCHGIGTSRCMGVIAEIYSDDRGLKWPETVAPFKFHLITNLDKDSQVNSQVLEIANKIYQQEFDLDQFVESYKDYQERLKVNLDQLKPGQLKEQEILWDDRQNVTLGEKFKDADLIGCPYQIILSRKSLEENVLEIKRRI